MRPEEVTAEMKQALIDQARAAGCTLDGAPASVNGRNRPFAQVRRRDGKGGVVEYAWSTVHRILNYKEGVFES